MTKAMGFVVLILAMFGVSAIWLWFATDYEDHIVDGKYALTSDMQQCNLVLKSDHSFQQEQTQGGKITKASGEWRRIGEGGMAFSKQFLIMPGQEPGADGTSYGEIHKTFGLFHQ